MTLVGLGAHRTIKKKKELTAGEKATIEYFPVNSCPVVEEYDDEYLELKSTGFFSNPVVKAFKTGKTIFKTRLYELHAWGALLTVTDYEYELVIQPAE